MREAPRELAGRTRSSQTRRRRETLKPPGVAGRSGASRVPASSRRARRCRLPRRPSRSCGCDRGPRRPAARPAPRRRGRAWPRRPAPRGRGSGSAGPAASCGHDLAQAAGVGDDAGTARRHRFERDEAERLVDRGHDADVGDPVERVKDVVADPAEERAVLNQPELFGLASAAPPRACPSRRPGSGCPALRRSPRGIASSASWKPFS